MHTLLKTARPNDTRLTSVPTDRLVHGAQSQGLGHRPRVMDLGCGTGLWMLQMAEKFPNVDYNGYDINFMLPKTLNQCIQPFIPFDIETPWNMGWAHWDLIHAQLMLGSICNWEYLFEQVKRHLAPGGWFESVEIDWQPRSDHYPDSPGLKKWWDEISEVYRMGNKPIKYNQNIVRDLEQFGFRDVKHEVHMIPLCGWNTTNQVLHRVGGWWNIAMSAGATDEGCFGLEAMSLRPLVELRHWPVDEVQRLCHNALAEASDVTVRAYNQLHVVTARAPRDDGS
jgi:SAM-dependent methyltransferase